MTVEIATIALDTRAAEASSEVMNLLRYARYFREVSVLKVCAAPRFRIEYLPEVAAVDVLIEHV